MINKIDPRSFFEFKGTSLDDVPSRKRSESFQSLLETRLDVPKPLELIVIHLLNQVLDALLSSDAPSGDEDFFPSAHIPPPFRFGQSDTPPKTQQAIPRVTNPLPEKSIFRLPGVNANEVRPGGSGLTLSDDFPPHLESRIALMESVAVSSPLPSNGSEKLQEGPDWEAAVEKASRMYQVDSALVRAVIQVESSGNPLAVSPAGAQGLMQLMPSTAAELGVNDPFDPGQNIMAGTRYLRQLLDRYQGDVRLALAAYNWGMGNLERNPHGMPKETRSYIVKVKNLYRSRTQTSQTG